MNLSHSDIGDLDAEHLQDGWRERGGLTGGKEKGGVNSEGNKRSLYIVGGEKGGARCT